MKLLVLGGSGFVSRYVCKEALANGHEVWCVTRGLRDAVPAGVRPVLADRNDVNALCAALRALGFRFDAVLDCICFNASQARADFCELAEFSSRFVVISTDSVYHPAFKAVPQNEDGAAYMVDDSYGGLKRQMEKAFLEECPENIQWTLFRPPHMFGAGSELGCFPKHTRQKDLIERLKAGERICLAGGGTYLLQPLYAGDLAKAMVAAAGNPKTYRKIFCIAGKDVVTNRQYFETVAEILGVPVAFTSEEIDVYNAAHDDGYLYFCQRVYDLSVLREAGLPVPQTPLRQGLEEQIAYILGGRKLPE